MLETRTPSGLGENEKMNFSAREIYHSNKELDLSEFQVVKDNTRALRMLNMLGGVKYGDGQRVLSEEVEKDSRSANKLIDDAVEALHTMAGKSGKSRATSLARLEAKLVELLVSDKSINARQQLERVENYLGLMFSKKYPAEADLVRKVGKEFANNNLMGALGVTEYLRTNHNETINRGYKQELLINETLDQGYSADVVKITYKLEGGIVVIDEIEIVDVKNSFEGVKDVGNIQSNHQKLLEHFSITAKRLAKEGEFPQEKNEVGMEAQTEIKEVRSVFADYYLDYLEQQAEWRKQNDRENKGKINTDLIKKFSGRLAEFMITLANDENSEKFPELNSLGSNGRLQFFEQAFDEITQDLSSPDGNFTDKEVRDLQKSIKDVILRVTSFYASAKKKQKFINQEVKIGKVKSVIWAPGAKPIEMELKVPSPEDNA